MSRWPTKLTKIADIRHKLSMVRRRHGDDTAFLAANISTIALLVCGVLVVLAYV